MRTASPAAKSDGVIAQSRASEVAIGSTIQTGRHSLRIGKLALDECRCNSVIAALSLDDTDPSYLDPARSCFFRIRLHHSNTRYVPPTWSQWAVDRSSLSGVNTAMNCCFACCLGQGIAYTRQ